MRKVRVFCYNSSEHQTSRFLQSRIVKISLEIRGEQRGQNIFFFPADGDLESDGLPLRVQRRDDLHGTNTWSVF